MWFYRNNIVAIHAALVVGAFAWLWGGMRGPVLVPVMPWLVALLAEAMLFFPERRGPDESTYLARDRVWKAMRSDPFVWVELVLLVLLVIPFVNTGLCPSCDARAIAQGVNPRPLIPFLPYCVAPKHHLTVFLWLLPAMTAVTAVKHSLTKSGKRLFCEMVVWNAAALAVLGFIQQIAGAPGPLWWNGGSTLVKPYFFSTFGYPNAGGSFFASCFALSVACWRRYADDVRAEYKEQQKRRTESKHRLFWRKHYMLIPTLLVFFGALNTLSRAAILLVSFEAVVLAVHAAVSTLARLKKAQRVRMGALMALTIVIIAILVSMFTPQSVRKEIDSINGSREVLNRVTSKTEYHSRVALDLFWEHPLFGCGGWGYAHLSPTKMTEKEMEVVKSGWGQGTANVHNDYLQFLVEHGAVGFACLVAMAVLLLLPSCRIWAALYKASRFAQHRPPPPRAIFALPGGAFAVLIGALAVLIHAFGDCPMRSPAVLSLFYCELAALDGFLPRLKTETEEEESE